jgi:hypothetical protein
MVWPQQREKAIWGPFDVESDTFNPDLPTMTITRSEADLKKYGSSELCRGDLILHLETGVTCRVLQRMDRRTARVEAWCTPEGHDEEAEKRAFAHWNTKQAQGRWVVWGQCFAPGEELPFAIPQEMKQGAGMTPEEQKMAMEARFDIYGAPKKPPRPFGRVRMKKKERRKLSRRLRGLAEKEWRQTAPAAAKGTINCPADLSLISDEFIDRKAFFRKTLKHGELRQWTMSLEELQRMRESGQGT